MPRDKTPLQNIPAPTGERGKKFREQAAKKFDLRTAPDWSHQCQNCGATPVVPLTGMCGPCTFGGNW